MCLDVLAYVVQSVVQADRTAPQSVDDGKSTATGLTCRKVDGLKSSQETTHRCRGERRGGTAVLIQCMGGEG